MRFVEDIKHLKQKLKKPVLTMGMFDGVHLAHQRIVQEVVRQAHALGGTSVILTFDPHPLDILQKKGTINLITSLEDRIALIRRLKVDVCVVINFNKGFSQKSARNFIQDILVESLGVHTVIIGKDFRFGKDRSGSFNLLEKFSNIYTFQIKQVKVMKIEGEPVSSTNIRSYIRRGQFKKVNRFLGRSFSICGKVVKGHTRGRILGYPTANIKPDRGIIPARGIYAVLVKIDNDIYPGILNIGARPTFKLKRPCSDTIEVHIFNFHKKIYNKRMRLFFIRRLRSEKRFISQERLIAQIKKDELKAKRLLSQKSFPKTNPI